MITAHKSLLLVLLQAHGTNVVPDAEDDSTPGFFLHVKHLRQLLAQLEPFWRLIAHKTKGHVEILLRGASELHRVKVRRGRQSDRVRR